MEASDIMLNKLLDEPDPRGRMSSSEVLRSDPTEFGNFDTHFVVVDAAVEVLRVGIPETRRW
jgi:hypothetical protein